MSLMSGGSLEDRLRQGPMPLVETERIIGRLAPALDAAHQRGVIHRDLKPANILFDQWNEPYLTDFGIVKLTGGSGGDSASLTTIGGIIGTPAYMSPEQVQGEQIDGRSDVYSLGVILFQMLSGRLPFDAATPIGLAFKHVSEPIPSIQALGRVRLPAEFQVIVNHAMAKQPDDRYPTALALSRDLSRLVHGSGPQPTVVLPREGGVMPTQRVGDSPASAPRLGPPTPAGIPWSAPPPPVTPYGSAPTARVEPPLPAAPPAAPAERRGPPLWLLGLLALLLIGGGAVAFVLLRGGDDEPEPTAVVVVAPAFTPSATATATTAATAAGDTAVAAATPEADTAAATPTPRPLKTAVTPVVLATPGVRALAAAEVRAGPGETFPVIAAVQPGTELPVIGRTEDSTWFNVIVPAAGAATPAPGWLPAAAVEALDAAALATVPVAATIPPSPTATPPPAATATRRPATPTLPPPTATQPPPTQPPPTQPPATEPPPPPEPTDPPPPPPTGTPVPVEEPTNTPVP
jgi:serine/threonine-protein kinase